MAVKINVRVITGAKRNEIVGWRSGILTIKIKSKPIKGKANQELIKILANTCHLAKNHINITKGAASSNKTISFTGTTPEKIKTYLD